jgi:hypothetical protein
MNQKHKYHQTIQHSTWFETEVRGMQSGPAQTVLRAKAGKLSIGFDEQKHSKISEWTALLADTSMPM